MMVLSYAINTDKISRDIVGGGLKRLIVHYGLRIYYII